MIKQFSSTILTAPNRKQSSVTPQCLQDQVQTPCPTSFSLYPLLTTFSTVFLHKLIVPVKSNYDVSDSWFLHPSYQVHVKPKQNKSRACDQKNLGNAVCGRFLSQIYNVFSILRALKCPTVKKSVHFRQNFVQLNKTQLTNI